MFVVRQLDEDGHYRYLHTVHDCPGWLRSPRLVNRYGTYEEAALACRFYGGGEVVPVPAGPPWPEPHKEGVKR